ncbi:MAG: hypothetical protein R3Y67_06555 [Eubacteriales bacterium]
MNYIRKNIPNIIPVMVWTMVLCIAYALLRLKISTYDVEYILLQETAYVQGWLLLLPFMVIAKIKRRFQRNTTRYPMTYATLLLYGVYFVITGFAGYETIQKMTVYHLVFTILCIHTYNGLLRVEEYIAIHKNKSYMPEGRIFHTSVLNLVLFIGVALLIALPLLYMKLEFVSFTVPELEITLEEEEVVEEDNNQSEGGGMDYDSLYQGEPNPYLVILWQVLERMAMVIVWCFVAYFLIRSLYRLIRNLAQTQVEERDLIESTFRQEEATLAIEQVKRHIKERFSRSHRMAVRRKYKKKLKPYEPKHWQTPAEMETMAQLDIQELHEEYEAIRYGASKE